MSDSTVDEETVGWLSQKEAQATLKCSIRQLQKLRVAGKLHSKLRDGRVVYDPQSLQEYLADKDVVPSGALHPEAIALERMVDLVRTLSAQTQAFAKLVLEPSRMLFEMAQAQNQRATARIEALEERHMQMLDAFEAAQTMAHERKLELKRAEANIETRAAMVKMFEPKVDRVLSSFGVKADFQKLVLSLEPIQLEALKGAGLLTDEQHEELVALQLKLRRTRKNGTPNSDVESGVKQSKEQV